MTDLIVHQVLIHDQGGHTLHLILLLLRGVHQGHLQLLPCVLLLGGPGYLHTLAHGVVIEVDTSGAIQADSLGTDRGALEYLE